MQKKKRMNEIKIEKKAKAEQEYDNRLKIRIKNITE